jgi:hypothetical protein
MCTRRLDGASFALAITLAAPLATGCEGSDVSWQIGFEDPADRANAVFVVARLREGSCTGVVRFEASAARGAQIATSVPELTGVHGVEAVAIDASCNEIATACEVRDLGEDEGDISLIMGHVDPPRVRCLGELCTAGSCRGCGTSVCADLGEPCDALTLCSADFMCSEPEGVCGLSREAAERCAEAPVVVLDDENPSRTTSAVIQPGPNVLGETSCGYDDVPEVFFEVSVAAGRWDLVLTTADRAPPPSSLDTALYAHAVCGDRRTELACNDDYDDATLLSRAEILDAGGRTFWVGVQSLDFESSSVPFELQASLRPVRASGETCDPAGAADRCARTPCDASGRCP